VTAALAQTPSTKKILVLGLGNTLLSDEGVGVYVIDELARQDPDALHADYMDGGTLSFTLAGPIEEAAALIVVDTAQLDQEPGSIRVFEGEAMDEFVGSGKKSSVHEVSLHDLLAIASLEGNLPERRALIGIQPVELDWGSAPSAPVAAAIPAACEAALELMRKWQV